KRRLLLLRYRVTLRFPGRQWYQHTIPRDPRVSSSLIRPLLTTTGARLSPDYRVTMFSLFFSAANLARATVSTSVLCVCLRYKSGLQRDQGLGGAGKTES
ncbi:hypothetical protein OTU49_005252, partial [Cherax quadricarinatus]